MIEVWHLNVEELTQEERFEMMAGLDKVKHTRLAKEMWEAGTKYTKVAEVDSNNLDVAFHDTNNIDTSWSMEPAHGVKVTAPLHTEDGETYGLRSSSVGDVFVLCWMGIRSANVISSFGFETIEVKDAKSP